MTREAGAGDHKGRPYSCSGTCVEQAWQVARRAPGLLRLKPYPVLQMAVDPAREFGERREVEYLAAPAVPLHGGAPVGVAMLLHLPKQQPRRVA